MEHDNINMKPRASKRRQHLSSYYWKSHILCAHLADTFHWLHRFDSPFVVRQQLAGLRAISTFVYIILVLTQLFPLCVDIMIYLLSTDGGSGCAGTVIGLGRSGHVRSCAGTVEVCWDWGLRSNYRAGFQGKYDLRVIDIAQCGLYMWLDNNYILDNTVILYLIIIFIFYFII